MKLRVDFLRRRRSTPARRQLAVRSRVPTRVVPARESPLPRTDRNVLFGLADPVRLAQLLVAGALITTALGAVYYFNTFVDMEQDVHTAVAQIDRELQRRSDLVRSLAPVVLAYASLEHQVFTEVAKVRTQLSDPPEYTAPEAIPPETAPEAPGAGQAGMTASPADGTGAGASAGAGSSPPGRFEPGGLSSDPIGALLTHFFAVAEQYPDMKSSAPFELFMERLVEIEDRLALERKNYNDCVNAYTTIIASFPGKIFAHLFGFESAPLFRADAAARGAVRAPLPEGWEAP